MSMEVIISAIETFYSYYIKYLQPLHIFFSKNTVFIHLTDF